MEQLISKKDGLKQKKSLMAKVVVAEPQDEDPLDDGAGK